MQRSIGAGQYADSLCQFSPLFVRLRCFEQSVGGADLVCLEAFADSGGDVVQFGNRIIHQSRSAVAGVGASQKIT